MLPLSPEAIAELIVDVYLARTVFEKTDRTPFAVAEVVRSLAERGAVAAVAGGRWRARTRTAVELAREAARIGQRRAVEARAFWLPPARRELLSLLALLGRETPARVLAAACATDQARVLEDLDALGRAGLVRLGEQGWATAHDLIGETVAEGLEAPERGRLHEMLARALRAKAADAAELARHLAAAGDAEGAAGAFADAGRNSLARYATEEAKRLAEAGLNLGPKTGLRSALLEIRAEARSGGGSWPERDRTFAVRCPAGGAPIARGRSPRSLY